MRDEMCREGQKTQDRPSCDMFLIDAGTAGCIDLGALANFEQIVVGTGALGVYATSGPRGHVPSLERLGTY